MKLFSTIVSKSASTQENVNMYFVFDYMLRKEFFKDTYFTFIDARARAQSLKFLKKLKQIMTVLSHAVTCAVYVLAIWRNYINISSQFTYFYIEFYFYFYILLYNTFLYSVSWIFYISLLYIQLLRIMKHVVKKQRLNLDSVNIET